MSGWSRRLTVGCAVEHRRVVAYLRNQCIHSIAPGIMSAMMPEPVLEVATEGLYAVTLEHVGELTSGGTAASEWTRLERVVYCKDHMAESTIRQLVDSLGSCTRPASTTPVGMVALGASGWKGVLRNVPRGGFPQQLRGANLSDPEYASTHVVVVRANFDRTSDGVHGPILVLCGLKYRGNVGTIVRSAVQTNSFERILIIDHVEVAEDAPAASSRIADKDIAYYSMLNAPLAHIEHFTCVQDFFQVFQRQHDPSKRTWVATALTKDSIDIYSSKGIGLLRDPSLLLFLGTEAYGLPQDILQRCHAIQIPTFSASLNVSCAFSVVSTVMAIGRRFQDL